MNKTDLNTVVIRNQLNEFLDKEVTAKRLFTGYGLFYDNHMFAIYRNNIFYLKAEDDLALYLEEKGSVCWVLNKDPKLAISHYYRLSREITDDKECYKTVVLRSIEQIIQNKLNIELSKKNRIKELANLSIKHERLLEKVGIKDVIDFKIVGYINCYIRLRKLGFFVNLDFLFNLYAALQNKHVSLVTLEERKTILISLNHALDDAGLRKINIEKYLDKFRNKE